MIFAFLTRIFFQLNVLIDNNGQAVICDCGLSRMRADITSRTATMIASESIVGGRNWMAPERLLGGLLKKPSDIYAFGMTLFEVSFVYVTLISNGWIRHQIFVNETPLGEVAFSEFIELVVRQNVRPERPDDEDAPYLSDAIWELAKRCWVKDPKERPTVNVVCGQVADLLVPSALGLLPNQSSTPAPSGNGDIVQQCLVLVPVPFLAPAFSTFKIILSSIKQVRASKNQLEVLVQSLAQFLQTLNMEYGANSLLELNTSTPLDELFRFVRFVFVRIYA